VAVSAPPCGYCRQLLAEAFCTQSSLRTTSGCEEVGGSRGCVQGANAKFELYIQPSVAPLLLEDLLPMAFGPRSLGIEGGLFSSKLGHGLELVPQAHANGGGSNAGGMEEGVWSLLTTAALEFAVRSHTPYTHSPAGVALLMGASDGSEPRGMRAEECGGGADGGDLEQASVEEGVGGVRAAASDAKGRCPGKIVGGSYYENCAFNPSISPIKAALVSAMCARLAADSLRCAVLVEVEGAKVSQRTLVRALVSAIAPACELRVVYARLRAEG